MAEQPVEKFTVSLLCGRDCLMDWSFDVEQKCSHHVKPTVFCDLTCQKTFGALCLCPHVIVPCQFCFDDPDLCLCRFPPADSV